MADHIEFGSISPRVIEQIVGQMRTEYEDGIMRAVQSVGFNVNKDRLRQALTDARAFYEEGYRAAMRNPDVVAVVRCKDCVWCIEKDELTQSGHCNCIHRDVFVGDPDGFEAVSLDDFCSYGEKRGESDV